MAAPVCRARIWAMHCGREDLAAVSGTLFAQSFGVCAEHFELHMFTSGLRNRIRHGSVPTIFKNQESTSKDEVEGSRNNIEGYDFVRIC